jgi:hypothetical protein
MALEYMKKLRQEAQAKPRQSTNRALA